MFGKTHSIVILLIVILSTAGTPYQLLFDSFTTAQGLSSNKITTVLQDSTGYLWIGSRSGLDLYDGYSFTHIRHDNSGSSLLTSDIILDMIEDYDGSFWIATSAGLTHLSADGTTSQHFTPDPQKPKALSNGYIIRLFRDSKNRIWIGTAWGLNRFNRRTGSFERFLFGNPENLDADRNRIWSIAEAPDGMLWVGTDNGVVVIDLLKDPIVDNLQQNDFPPLLKKTSIRAMLFDNDGAVWIGTLEGLFRFYPKTGALTHYRSHPADVNSLTRDQISSLCLDHNGDLWVGTTSGLNKFIKQSNSFKQILADADSPVHLVDNHINTIYEDRSHIIWIGTDGGLAKYSPSMQNFHSLKISINGIRSDNNIFSLTQIGKASVWLSTPSGIYEWNLDNDSFQILDHVFKQRYCREGSHVRALYKQNDRSLWIASQGGDYGGIYHYNLITKTARLFSRATDSNILAGNKLNCMSISDTGRLWVGTEGAGVQVLDLRTGETKRYLSDYNSPDKLAGNWIFCMKQDSKGRMWIGTENGLTLFDPSANSFTSFQHQPDNQASISSNEILCLHEDKNGAIWIGTNSGLNLYQGDNSFKVYNQKHGLEDISVRAIVEDEGLLWISTAVGISAFGPKFEEAANYNSNDGILVTDFNAGAGLKLADGTIIFGGHNGLVRFNPRQLQKPSIIPQVVISKISNFRGPIYQGKELAGKKSIEMSYNDNFIEFQLAVLDFTSPATNRFSYKLEGFDRRWRLLTESRKATYPKLPPGEYLFRVKGATSFSPWNEQGAAIKIHIVPPFWNTPWFKMVSFLLFVFLFITISKVQYKRAKARRRLLEQLVTERTRELAEKNTELQRAKENYQNLYDHAPIGFQEIDINGVIIMANETACNILGFSKEEMIGRSIFDFIIAEERKEARHNFAQILKVPDSEGALERTYVRKNGELVVLAIKYKIIQNKSDGVNILRNAFQDISEIRQLEEQLRQSQRLEAIGRLAGGIAHDFNNILTIIRGYCSILMRKTTEQPAVHNVLSKIDEAGERAEKLTRQLLAFSRRQQLQPQVINLNRQLVHINEMLSRLLGENIFIKMNLANDLHNIKVDPDQFEHMVINMSANARDAMAEGGQITFITENFTVEHRLEIQSGNLEPGEYVHLSISDTGIGIQPEMLKHIFEPFYTEKERGKGTGLGLAMAYGFIKQSAGHIGVESTPGKGTRFDIYFPVCDELLETVPEDESKDINVSGHERILVVEDEEHVRNIIGQALQEHGYAVHLSSEVKSDIDKALAEQQDFDLIISDVIMPTQNGPQVVGYVQSRFPNIKVLYMSGYSDDHISSQGILNTGVNFLQKPFTPKDLLVKIRTVLDENTTIVNAIKKADQN